MEKLLKHRKAIKKMMKRMVKEYYSGTHSLEMRAVMDDKSGTYILLKLGWHDKEYIYTPLFHFDLKDDGKVWLQYNMTEDELVDELMEAGVARTDIVLGLAPPHARGAFGFAAA